MQLSKLHEKNNAKQLFDSNSITLRSVAAPAVARGGLFYLRLSLARRPETFPRRTHVQPPPPHIYLRWQV